MPGVSGDQAQEAPDDGTHTLVWGECVRASRPILQQEEPDQASFLQEPAMEANDPENQALQVVEEEKEDDQACMSLAEHPGKCRDPDPLELCPHAALCMAKSSTAATWGTASSYGESTTEPGDEDIYQDTNDLDSSFTDFDEFIVGPGELAPNTITEDTPEETIGVVSELEQKTVPEGELE